MNRILAMAAFISLVTSSALAGGAALVIGNGDYANAPDAVTAVRDAKSVADELSEAGWQVSVGTDLDRTGMRRAFSEFTDAAKNAEEVVIYYSGHALRTGGVTYLAPVDATANSLTDVLFDGVPLDLALQLAAEKPGKAVIFLDGAQLRGFTPTEFVEPGMAALEGPDEVLIVSAAEPGRAIRRSPWRDSRFARLIVDRFLQPGDAAVAVAAELDAPTFTTGSADDDFAIVPEPEPADGDTLEREIELAYWRTAERSNRAEDYTAYLERYPEGAFAEFARQRLGIDRDSATIPEEPSVPPEIQAERDLNLSRIRKRQIQTWLMALGHDPNGIDGLFGPGTRKAVRAWQGKNSFDANGWLTAEQVDSLRQQGDAAILEQRRIAEEQRRIREAEDNAYWSETGAPGTPDGYRAYIEKYPEGLHAKIARAALAKIAEAKADAKAQRDLSAFERARKRNTAEAYRNYLGTYPEGIYRDEALAGLDAIESRERAKARRKKLQAAERALKLSKADRKSVEQRLALLGFAPGAADGKFDSRTRAAIRGYQDSRELKGQGYLNRNTVVLLVKESDSEAKGRKNSTQVDGARIIEELVRALNK